MLGVKSKRAAPRAQPERKCKNAKVGGTASSAAQPKPMKCGAGVKLESHPSDWILDVLIGNNRYITRSCKRTCICAYSFCKKPMCAVAIAIYAPVPVLVEGMKRIAIAAHART